MIKTIEANGLSKLYRLGARAGQYVALRDVLTHSFKRLVRPRERPIAETAKEQFWALKDVGFEAGQGERLGILGRNGAGKSTLLKILSRITDPTAGTVKVRGRIASLLEVGTGFHPELTGRENIFLNGSILGMSRTEIKKKFDEIVSFAEVEQFLDTPVKRYSSGMYIRLAFAVAAFLESEILLVDEVLAVGDAAFQKKCLGKMSTVSKDGRTVLFVSHNMGAMTKLCDKGIWLEGGRLKATGPIEEVVSKYLMNNESGVGEFTPDPAYTGKKPYQLVAVRVRDQWGKTSANLDVRAPIQVEIEYKLTDTIRGLRNGFRLLSHDGTVIFSTTDLDDVVRAPEARGPGRYVSRCTIPGAFLNTGQYTVALGIDIPMIESILFIDNAVSFFVEATGGLAGDIPDRRLGMICPELPWEVTNA